ncbi:transcription termination factor 2 [Phthorimaea operculella]|nr:transcription termination factor 2 [Phthorimaea operculella]
MENSFFEYRDKTGAESASDSEVIDNSIEVDDSFALLKTPAKKNQTVFVAESEESSGDDELEDVSNGAKGVPGRSSLAVPTIVSSSDDDTNKRGSIRRQTGLEMSFNNVVLSSSDSDEEQQELSPEIVPKRRPPQRPAKVSIGSDTSIIGRKKNKRMVLQDSDTENSIIIEHNKNKKMVCLKDTPATEDEGPDEDQMVYSRATRMSIMGVIPKGVDESDDDSDFIQSDEKSRASSALSLNDLPDVTIAKPTEEPQVTASVTPEKHTVDGDTSRISCSPFGSPLHDITNEFNQIEDSCEPKKQGLKPNELKSTVVTDLTKKVNKENDYDDDVTFVSTSFEEAPKRKTIPDEDVTFVSSNQKGIRTSSNQNSIRTYGSANKKSATPRSTFGSTNHTSMERVIDDDITIVESKPEIIALSSDDEDELKAEKSPIIKRSPKEQSSSRKDGTMKQYLVPPSYPNQQVVYVKKHVRENELSKLQGLKEDLHNIKYLLENMDMETLPDGGVKLIERLTGLEQMVRQQGEKVANMVVEPDMPSADDMAKDGFDAKTGLSWEQLQKGSQAVQPRMFGKQAMATHMAERNLILDRLRDLHESLASRPPESQLAPPPPAVKSKMMQHQLHALAWLRWRETQRPRGGILADDMGLGKTITMISLIVSDKDGKLDEDSDEDDEGGRGISKLARGGTLVVCPASLMQQWSGEVTKHCTSHAASVCLHHGANRATHPHRLATYDIVLTTYNILQRDNEKNGVLMKVLWRRIILDEAHIVRNHKSATSMAVSALKGSRRWCLTGTPVQNKDLDLFALLKFLRCTPFDELTMWKKWIDNKSQGGSDRLSTIMQCILLRRTKVQLQEKGQLNCLPERTTHLQEEKGQLNCLPERTTHLQEVTLTKDEMNVYQKVLVFSKTLFAQFLHQRAEKQADMQGLATPDKNSAYDKMHKKMVALQGAKPVKSHEILVLLLRLRQVCCHCGLIAAMLDEETAGDGVDMDPGGQDLLAELNKLSIEDNKNKRKGTL